MQSVAHGCSPTLFQLSILFVAGQKVHIIRGIWPPVSFAQTFSSLLNLVKSKTATLLFQFSNVQVPGLSILHMVYNRLPNPAQSRTSCSPSSLATPLVVQFYTSPRHSRIVRCFLTLQLLYILIDMSIYPSTHHSDLRELRDVRGVTIHQHTQVSIDISSWPVEQNTGRGIACNEAI